MKYFRDSVFEGIFFVFFFFHLLLLLYLLHKDARTMNIKKKKCHYSSFRIHGKIERHITLLYQYQVYLRHCRLLSLCTQKE